MKNNICSDCIKKVRSTTIGLISNGSWDNICEVCRENSAVFYARQDELSKLKSPR